jgi:hypothetical protein
MKIIHEGAVQLELDLAAPRSAVIALPPCGRGFGPCRAVVERHQIRCLICRCVAPRKRAPTFLDGFIRSELKFLRSRIAPGVPGK